MSDLVERLRAPTNWLSEDFGDLSCTPKYDQSPFDAADELERQAKEISSLVQAVADHVTVRSEQFAKIERQAKEIAEFPRVLNTSRVLATAELKEQLTSLRAVAKEMAEALDKSDALLRDLPNSGGFYGLAVMEANEEALVHWKELEPK